MTSAPKENCPPSLRLTLTLTQALTLTGGKFSSGALVRITVKRIIKFRNCLSLVNLSPRCWFSKAVVHRCFSQYSQENTCAGPGRPSFTEHLRWLLLDFRGSKNIFCSAAESGFIADSRTGFYPDLHRKHDLNLRSSHWNSSVKKVFLEVLQISQENTCVKAFLTELQTPLGLQLC